MEAYKERFVREFQELKDKTDKLDAMLRKYENGKLDFEFDCPVEVLYAQLRLMQAYMDILLYRAKYEGIPVSVLTGEDEEI